MCKTGEKRVFALACSQALAIVNSKDDKSISTISTHLKGKDILSISFCGDKRLVLAISGESITLFDFLSDKVLATFENPSDISTPYTVISLKNGERYSNDKHMDVAYPSNNFIIQDESGLYVVDINSK